MAQDQKKKQLFTYSPSSDLLDDVNLRLLDDLRRDPRLTMAELGRRIGMSSPAVTERVRRLEEAGIILGYRLDINPASLGLTIGAYIRIRPNPANSPGSRNLPIRFLKWSSATASQVRIVSYLKSTSRQWIS